MYNKSSIETNGKPDREKSRSSLSLLWEEIYGAQIDLQGYVESCWNNLKTVDIDLDGPKTLDLKTILDKPLLHDSGTSSLNDEDQCSVVVGTDHDNNATYKSPVSVKGFVEQFSHGVKTDIEGGKWKLVVKELLDTENAYLLSLKEVDDGYLEKFFVEHRDNDDIKVIFSNWKKLRQFHSQFQAQMRLTIHSGFSGLKKLANCFISDVAKFEDLYSDYCLNYSKSIKHLNHIENLNTEVWQHLLKCQHELGHALPLSTFLLKPVQRILKYQLLLQELIHSCESVITKESKDVMQCLLQALEEMITVASRINDRQTEQEELSRQIHLRNELYAEIVCSNPSFPDLGYPFHDGELKVPGSRNTRVALLCQSALVLAKRLGNSRWDVKQVIRCEKMMLFEFIPKQPLGFYIVDLSNPKSKSTLLALTKEDKDVWCTKIKELIIGSYDAGLISDRAKRILLENKHDVLAMNDPTDGHVIESHQVKLYPDEEELLDLETTLRRMLDPAMENRFSTSRNLSVKRRNSVGVDKTDLKMNYRDPSIYQKAANRRLVEMDHDLDCRSIMIDVNEEALREAGGVVSMQIQTYERYIDLARTKIRLTPEDIEEIFLPLRQLSVSTNKDSCTNSPAPLADIEMVAFCSDQESTASDRPPTATMGGRHRKAASMDRTYGLTVNGKANSCSNYLHIDQNNTAADDDLQRKKPLFSSVRGTKATRSNTDWCATVDPEIRPGIVKSISRLFRASSKFTKRDKARAVTNHSISIDSTTSTLTHKMKAQLNKSNSTDHIVQPPFLLPKSHFGKKCRAPPPPPPSANLAQIARIVKEELDECEFLHPTKPPRKMIDSRAVMLGKAKSSSTEGLRSSQETPFSVTESVSQSASPFKVKDLVTMFQKAT